MKGIVLAGGSGTRLYPATIPITKQLIPIYNKPMIYYPISVLMLSKIKEILIISTPSDLPLYKKLLGDGSQYGLKFSYEEQPNPGGLAQAFLIGEKFIEDQNVCLVLGDNIFFGQGLIQILESAKSQKKGATVFGYHVQNPEHYGVVTFNQKKVVSIEEKPKKPTSNYAVTGLYFYDNDVIKIAKNLKPSARGELEITDINNNYLKKGNLNVEILGRGISWLDTGTFDTLIEAGNLVQAIENRQGLKIACLEEIGFNNGWISKSDLESRLGLFKNSSYGLYLKNLVKKN
jgi:glucose-1-phosphate thymidylyltransferase